ncbi:hypothetical protein [Zavarzinia sp. CC-PAN008]|uniref:hypothetical protein n=1 Tax=Zavarzinia sp. CC-PAN008 TaxID=3243332 RepID=UPI003F74730A
MTVNASYAPARHVGDGVSTEFPFSFALVDVAHLQVTVAHPPPTGGSDYEIYPTPAWTAGDGAVVFSDPLPVDDIVLIERVVPILQGTDLVDGGAFPADTTEAALDLVVMQVQQVQGDVGRVLRAPALDDPDIDLTLPAAGGRANRVAAWDADGQPITTTIATPGFLDQLAVSFPDPEAPTPDLVALEGLVGVGVAKRAGDDAWALLDSGAFGEAMLAAEDAAEGRGLLELGTMAQQDAGNVDISGGFIQGANIQNLASALPIASGGTGQTSAGAALAALGGQPADADLTALAGLSATAGMLARTGANAFAQRTLTAPAAGITISNPTGAAGNPTLALADDLAALEALAATGLAARTGANAWAQRQIVAPAAGITVTNPAGIAGDPTLALADDLAALEALAATGLAARTGANAWAQRQIVAPAAGITIANPAGIAGDPTLALANDLAALEGLGTTGLAVRSALDTWLTRALAVGSGLTVSNGDGVAGAPTVGLDTKLAAINALTWAADKLIRLTGAGSVDSIDFNVTGWTPDLNFGGANTGITYTSRDGVAVRFANIVIGLGVFLLSSKGSATGAATITGLPYTVTATSRRSPVPAWTQRLTWVAGWRGVFGLPGASGTTLSLFATTDSSFATVDDTAFAAATEMRVFFAYQT